MKWNERKNKHLCVHTKRNCTENVASHGLQLFSVCVSFHFYQCSDMDMKMHEHQSIHIIFSPLFSSFFIFAILLFLQVNAKTFLIRLSGASDKVASSTKIYEDYLTWIYFSWLHRFGYFCPFVCYYICAFMNNEVKSNACNMPVIHSK